MFAADGQTLTCMSARVDAELVARVQARVRRRVLAAYRRHGVLNAEDAHDLAGWDHGGGFWVDAAVGIATAAPQRPNSNSTSGSEFQVARVPSP